MMDADERRAERIARERAAGVYIDPGLRKFLELRAARDAGKSLQSVCPPFLRRATPAMLRGVGRNDACPCGSGRKAKFCCGGPR